MATRGPRVRRFILNCDPSTDLQSDWTFEDAVEAGVVADNAAPAPRSETRATGACVGFAAAAGVLHWHYRQAHLLRGDQPPSPRFIGMANEETDLLTSHVSQWTALGTKLRGPPASCTSSAPHRTRRSRGLLGRHTA